MSTPEITQQVPYQYSGLRFPPNGGEYGFMLKSPMETPPQTVQLA